METLAEDLAKKESFRDRIATADAEGKRVWIYPKKPKGKLTSARTVVSIILYAIFFLTPFMKVNGEPLILLNVMERKFILFGMIFMPQDFHLFLLAMITFIVFIVLFTAVFGRVFCGWVCPQTIFMEMLFRKIEYAIEGDYKSQMLLSKKTMNTEKFFKKSLKHTLFILVSFIISNTFLMYVIGFEEWMKLVKEPIDAHLSGFTAIVVFTGVFYWIFARFREQVCTTVCPYGRLQGVLLDKNSMVVAYDYRRGETRGKIRKNEVRATAGKGDCIDCNQCVNVCPTGIDIRNGTQMECIGCTACIDACNYMMKNVGLAEGLIRYDSEAGIAEGKKFRITKRIKAYTAILAILFGILVALLITRSDTETTIVRARGTMYQESAEGISNIYNYSIVNKVNMDYPIEIRTMDKVGKIRIAGGPIIAKGASTTSGTFLLYIEGDAVSGMKTKIKIGIYSNGKLLEEVKATFLAPAG